MIIYCEIYIKIYQVDLHKGKNNFLIAEQEKALIDCLYISARKKNQFGYFPELHFPKSFNFSKTKEWAKKIPDVKIRKSVLKKLDDLFLQYKVN